MARFSVKLQHSEKTFEALAHKQYDLFCTGNRIARTALCLVAVSFGVMYYSQWWGIFAIAYGCYLITSTYSSANHTAHKLSKSIRESGMPFPASEYRFEDKGMTIQPLSDADGAQGAADELSYSKIIRLGEDAEYFYLFPNESGGYMVRKDALGDGCRDFKSFIEGKTSLRFQKRVSPLNALVSRLKGMLGK